MANGFARFNSKPISLLARIFVQFSPMGLPYSSLFYFLRVSMIPARYSKLIAVFFVACISILAGCSSEGSVTGKVTLDGQPIDLGALTFQSPGQPTLSATIREDGTYELEHAGERWVPPGDYVVTVRGYERDKNQKRGTPPNHKVITPDIYASVKTSDLSAEVKAGSNRFDFDLKSAK
ncbi:carboxypeptidase-like regulatory domain-containing protein [Mariniblastus sp.]|nr:carboxypeptidase-like regulatory domain-containing protein [Mariniblastus sp.]